MFLQEHIMTHVIIGTTLGHPGAWHNKTLVLFDELINKVQNGDIPKKFSLSCWREIKLTML